MMKRAALVVFLVQTGCIFDTSGVVPDGGSRSELGFTDSTNDASTDGVGWIDAALDLAGDGLITDETAPDKLVPDTKPLCETWTPAPTHFDPCEIPLPTGALTVSTSGTWIYDTDSGTLMDPDGATSTPKSTLLAQPSGASARLISVDGFVLGKNAKLRAIGSVPLILASWSVIDIDGTIDASSRIDFSTGDARKGAGANPSTCASHAATDGDVHYGEGGGGGGGGFGAAGGDGGKGDNGWASSGEGGATVSMPAEVRGGCAGGDGGGDQNPGGGGPGGGALSLCAKISIAVGGTLHAGGAVGSPGGSFSDGAGGGGSGGLVELEAPALTLEASAVLAANGGAGSEGATNSTPGNYGENSAAAATAAKGGAGVSVWAGNGGNGGYLDSEEGGVGALAEDGGGGGGGGVGFVLLRSSNINDQGATFSPDYMTP